MRNLVGIRIVFNELNITSNHEWCADISPLKKDVTQETVWDYVYEMGYRKVECIFMYYGSTRDFFRSQITVKKPKYRISFITSFGYNLITVIGALVFGFPGAIKVSNSYKWCKLNNMYYHITRIS